MAFPPPTLPTNRTNATPQQDNHPADHNAYAEAINDITAVVTPYASRIGVGLTQASQSVAAGAQVALSWPTEEYDTNAFHGSGSSTVTIPAGLSGLYAVTFRVGVGGSGTVSVVCDVIVNIDGVLYQDFIPAGKGGAAMCLVLPILAGDIIEGRVFNGQPGAQFFNGGLHVNYIRPI